MTNYREICFTQWGKQCAGCGVGIGVEVHHIDKDHSNNNPSNLMPLCGTCHNLVTVGTLEIDPPTREITTNIVGLFELGPLASNPPHEVQIQLLRFKKTVAPWETEAKLPFLLLQDGCNNAYYLECHVQANKLASLFFEDAVLNPEDLNDPDAEEYKLNRDIFELHAVFRRMQADAEDGRPFSDIIVEFNENYEPERPLKIPAGQHRARVVCDAVQADKQAERLHGIKVYFSLDKGQRSEISLVSNTNIAISKQLIDRLGEQHIGNESRKWCQQVGLLDQDKDFADRLTGDDRFTVQMLRSLVVNYHRGQTFSGDIDGKLHESVYLPKTGSLKPDPEYEKIIKNNPAIWGDPALLDLGRNFAELARKQQEAYANASDKNKDLRKVGFKYKAFTPTIAAGWAYVAGLLQSDQQRLRNHYSLPSKYEDTKSPDPLNAKQMSVTRHETADDPTYRGLATRQSAKDAQRVVELFLMQSKSELAGTVTKQLLNAAVQSHVTKVNQRDREEWERQAKEAAKQIRREIS